MRPWHRTEHSSTSDVDLDGLHLRREDKRRLVAKILDDGGFPWRVVFASGLGFFTFAYNVYILNVVLPILNALYWPGNTTKDLVLKELSLVGLTLGQVFMCHLADTYGRKTLQSIELIMVTLAAVGFAQSSSGVNGSMSTFGWLCAWRALLCLGIGAEYPLASVITAEWSPTGQRPRALAAVFLMQPVGQLAGALVAFAVSSTMMPHDGHMDGSETDKSWRILAGTGAIPALVVLLFRLTIPESPRFVMDVQANVDAAFDAVKRHDTHADAALNISITRMMANQEIDEGYRDSISQSSVRSLQRSRNASGFIALLQRYKTWVFRETEYLKEGNWRYLATVASCYFVVAWAVSSLDASSPTTLRLIWPRELTDSQPLQALRTFSLHFIYVTAIGSIAGAVFSVLVINFMRRKSVLEWTTLSVAIVILIIGILFSRLRSVASSGVLVALYILCQITLNFGPSLLLFMIPSEIFPTRYRATFFGLSAASGNYAQIIIEAVLYSSGAHRAENLHWRTALTCAGAALCLLAALLTWAWLPDVQRERVMPLHKAIALTWKHNLSHPLTLPNVTLEELGKGFTSAQAAGEVTSFRSKIAQVLRMRSSERACDDDKEREVRPQQVLRLIQEH